MKKIIDANLHPVLTWHPSAPRREGEKIEPELWEETNGWNPGVILWVVSPDKKVREPIEYLKVKSAKVLEEKIREILKKNGVAFVEPPAGKD